MKKSHTYPEEKQKKFKPEPKTAGTGIDIAEVILDIICVIVEILFEILLG